MSKPQWATEVLRSLLIRDICDILCHLLFILLNWELKTLCTYTHNVQPLWICSGSLHLYYLLWSAVCFLRNGTCCATFTVFTYLACYPTPLSVFDVHVYERWKHRWYFLTQPDSLWLLIGKLKPFIFFVLFIIYVIY